MRTPICLLTPNNFAHKAGDGTKTRKREVRFIHPALQANCVISVRISQILRIRNAAECTQ